MMPTLSLKIGSSHLTIAEPFLAMTHRSPGQYSTTGGTCKIITQLNVCLCVGEGACAHVCMHHCVLNVCLCVKVHVHISVCTTVSLNNFRAPGTEADLDECCPSQCGFSLTVTNFSDPTFPEQCPHFGSSGRTFGNFINSHNKECSIMQCFTVHCNSQQSNPNVKRGLTVNDKS